MRLVRKGTEERQEAVLRGRPQRRRVVRGIDRGCETGGGMGTEVQCLRMNEMGTEDVEKRL